MRSEIDFLKLDELLGEEERLIRDSVRGFVNERVLPIIGGCYREGRFPRELIAPLAELGVLGPTVEGYGGAGASPLAYGVIMSELERGDSGIRSFCSVQSSLVIYPILTFGSEAQKERWLPKLISGEAIGCFGLTEPDFGSNPSGMRTRARKDGHGYVLEGSKRWITNGTEADVAVVFAKNDEGKIEGFLVEAGTPGYTAREMEGKLSLRASITGELFFDDCRIPAEARLPGAKGLRSALACLNQARFGIAFGALGAAEACLEEALEYTGSRVQFDRPIAGFQLVQRELVEVYQALVQARLLCHRLAELKTRGDVSPVAISLAKRNNVAMALDAARRCRDLLGANGVVDDYAAMRHACNLEAVKTYEGTHNIHTLIVGQALTGLAAFT